MKKRFSRIKKKKGELEVDITSLLDILVILLVFLLKSYNASDLKLEVAKNVKLPSSKSMSFGQNSVIVQVGSSHDLWINNTKIGSVLGSGEKIDILYDRLVEIKKEKEKEIVTMEGRDLAAVDKDVLLRKKINKGRVNIVLDQSLSYSVLRKVMNTSALAGFPEFKFIVQGNF